MVDEVLFSSDVAPLATNVPIVDENGNPTPYFMRIISTWLKEKKITEDQLFGLGLEGLDDVDIVTSAPVLGDLLYYDGTVWKNLHAGSVGQFLKTNGTSSAPVWATAGAASSTTFALQQSGTFYPPDSQGFDTAAVGVSANGLYAFPFSKGITLDALLVEITTGVGGSNVRFGIYEMDGTNGMPKTLVMQTGTVSSATTGNKVGTLPSNYTVTHPVWIVVNFSAAVSIRGGEQLSDAANIFGSTSMNVTLTTTPPRAFATYAFASLPADASSLSWGVGNSSAMMAARAL